jgi:hypothetical protein
MDPHLREMIVSGLIAIIPGYGRGSEAHETMKDNSTPIIFHGWSHVVSMNAHVCWMEKLIEMSLGCI